MGDDGTLILTGSEVDAALDPAACIAAVDAAFRARGEGRGGPAATSGVATPSGTFHVKSAAEPGGEFFVAKINSNFPGNPDCSGLPTIQGVVALFDGKNGRLLALLDSVRLTALRTAAASATAVRALAREGASSLLLVGCGVQARAHLDALRVVRPLIRIELHDASTTRARSLADYASALGLSAGVADDLRTAARRSDVIVTSTPSVTPILELDDVGPGTCVAAVGADNEHKQEIAPALMRRARVVADVLDQSATMGDLRGAIVAGVMTRGDVHAELGEILAGRRPGRTSEDQIFIFDSTGVAFQDVAVAVQVYRRSREAGGVRSVRFRE